MQDSWRNISDLYENPIAFSIFSLALRSVASPKLSSRYLCVVVQWFQHTFVFISLDDAEKYIFWQNGRLNMSLFSEVSNLKPAIISQRSIESSSQTPLFKRYVTLYIDDLTSCSYTCPYLALMTSSLRTLPLMRSCSTRQTTCPALLRQWI